MTPSLAALGFTLPDLLPWAWALTDAACRDLDLRPPEAVTCGASPHPGERARYRSGPQVIVLQPGFLELGVQTATFVVLHELGHHADTLGRLRGGERPCPPGADDWVRYRASRPESRADAFAEVAGVRAGLSPALCFHLARRGLPWLLN